ncbi:hypothetical protein ABT364_28135 [Massilia sp. SR12]
MDHPDRAWKLLLQRHLPRLLARLFPAIHALIDWRLQYYLPDKSLLPRAADSRNGEREPDFVAIVTLLDGSPACLHVEVQCTRQASFPDRMAQYHARLRDRFGMRVISLAILGDCSPTWRPHANDDHCGMTLEFHIAKLLDSRDALNELRQTLDPVSIALAAHLTALATRRKPGLRYTAKLSLMLPLYRLRGKLRELTEIQEVIDLLLPLTPLWQRRFTMDVEKFLEEHKKQDKNSLNYIVAEHFIQQGLKEGFPKGEALGIAKGKAVGLAKGKAVGLAEGKAVGLAEGKAVGLAEGKAVGLAEGKAVGLAKGKAVGLAEGKAAGLAKGEAAGLSKGLSQGQAQTLKLQLQVKFGQPSRETLRALERARPEQLERLAIALLDAESAAEALRAAGLNLRSANGSGKRRTAG